MTISESLENTTLNNGVKSPGGYAELWFIAYPLIITNATTTVMQFVDRKFLAMNSTNDVAAALPGGILAFTLFTFFMITTGFTAAIVAQNHGKNNIKACSRIPWSGFYFSLIAGLFCSLFLTYPGLLLIEFGHHAPDLMAGEKAYFKMLMPSGGFIFITTAFCAFFSGQGRTWVVAIVHLIASLINIVLDYILIFGKYGAPAMGITGAGLATTIACVFGALIAFLFFIFQDQSIHPTRKNWHINIPDIRRLIAFGAPAGGEVFFSVGAFSFIIFLIGRIGSIELAASTIALSINMLTFMPLLGISEATGIITGKYIGAKRSDIAEKVAYKSWIISTAYMILMGAIYLLYPEPLLDFFAPSEGKGVAEFVNVLKIGKTILICAAIYNVFNALRFVFMGALRGAGDTKVPMWIIITCSWTILAPGGYIIINVLKLSVIHLWVFLTVYGGIVGSLIFLRFKSGAWKKMNMLNDNLEAYIEPALIESLDYESDTPHV